MTNRRNIISSPKINRSIISSRDRKYSKKELIILHIKGGSHLGSSDFQEFINMVSNELKSDNNHDIKLVFTKNSSEFDISLIYPIKTSLYDSLKEISFTKQLKRKLTLLKFIENV